MFGRRWNGNFGPHSNGEIATSYDYSLICVVQRLVKQSSVQQRTCDTSERSWYD
jgi:hypothetical protein